MNLPFLVDDNGNEHSLQPNPFGAFDHVITRPDKLDENGNRIVLVIMSRTTAASARRIAFQDFPTANPEYAATGGGAIPGASVGFA